MWPILALAGMTIQRQVTYRIATLSGLATNIFFGLLRASVMVALYTGFAQANGLGAETMLMRGMSMRQAVDFTGITQAILVYMALFGWWEFMELVRTGDIGSELLKPMNLYLSWLARDIGRALAGLVMRGAPILLVFVLLFDTRLPQSITHWLTFAVAMVLGLWVSFGWRFLLNLCSFWTVEVRGIGRAVFGFAYMLSGFLMPLRFYPDWIRAIAWATPFPATITVPVDAFLGVNNAQDMAGYLLIQALWGLGLALACQVVMRRGMRKLVIQGG